MPQQHTDLVPSPSDSSSSDEEDDVQVPINEAHLVDAYRKLKCELKSIKMKKKLLTGQEKFKRLEKNLLKKMLLVFRTECKEKSEILLVPQSIQKTIAPHCTQLSNNIKLYKLCDDQKGYYINIIIKQNRPKKYYLTIKRLLRKMVPYILKYKEVVPFEIMQYVLRLVLEKRINELLKGKEEKFKHKEVFSIYRNTYPFNEDKKIVERALSAIQNGDYNNPEEMGANAEETSSGLPEAKLQTINNSANVTEIETDRIAAPS